MAEDFKMVWHDPAVLQTFGKDWSEQAGRIATANLNQGTEMARWLIASLLIINSGGLLAVINNAPHITAAACAATCFVLGLLGALLNGWLLQYGAMKGFEAGEGAFRYWANAAISGIQDEEFERKVWASERMSLWLGRASPYAGWAAIAAFVAGVVVIARSYI